MMKANMCARIKQWCTLHQFCAIFIQEGNEKKKRKEKIC